MKIHPTPMHICKYHENVTAHVIVTFAHMQIPRKRDRTCYCYLRTYMQIPRKRDRTCYCYLHRYARTVLNKNIQKYEPTVST